MPSVIIIIIAFRNLRHGFYMRLVFLLCSVISDGFKTSLQPDVCKITKILLIEKLIYVNSASNFFHIWLLWYLKRVTEKARIHFCLQSVRTKYAHQRGKGSTDVEIVAIAIWSEQRDAKKYKWVQLCIACYVVIFWLHRPVVYAERNRCR